MTAPTIDELFSRNIVHGNHAESNYFALIKSLVKKLHSQQVNPADKLVLEKALDSAYALVEDEIASSQDVPVATIEFGTSGWRGILGKDLFVKSVGQVTLAIVQQYYEMEGNPELARILGVADLAEARKKGGVVGYDNRFGGELLARRVVEVLTAHGFTVHYAGESTTGTLSAAVLQLKAAFSINLTPSHNPLEYGGFKYNAADGGPAASLLTAGITAGARKNIETGNEETRPGNPALVQSCDALSHWFSLVRMGKIKHGLDYDAILAEYQKNTDMVVVVDCVHGASRIHIRRLLPGIPENRLVILRESADYTFGGIAPEPSSVNMTHIISVLKERTEKLKLGVIIDPDADRIRFTDGTREITMNHFGAMAYHFLHEKMKRPGLVAKTVATSNFANTLAEAFGEEVYETRVGFKEFKPVIDRALVCFEESDGISIIGHTPEKDAYIGLLLAIAMMQELNIGIGEYLALLENEYGRFCPTKDGLTVSRKGEELTKILRQLRKYIPGGLIQIGNNHLRIAKVLDIDGYKIVLEDGGWLMIRPSGTEPKVRFYVESRDPESQKLLLQTAVDLLKDIGLA